jgi:hypothetical protein
MSVTPERRSSPAFSVWAPRVIGGGFVLYLAYSAGLQELLVIAEILLVVIGPMLAFVALQLKKPQDEQSASGLFVFLLTTIAGFAVLIRFGDQIESFNTWVLDAARSWVDRS